MVSESHPAPSHAGRDLGGQSHLSDPHWHFPPATDSARPSAIPEDSNPAPDALEAIVTVTETLEELQLPQEAVEESESRGAIYSIPIMEDGGGGSSTPEDPAETPRTLLGNSNPSSVHLRGWCRSPARWWGYGSTTALSFHRQFSGPRLISLPLPSQQIPLPTLGLEVLGKSSFLWEVGASFLWFLLPLTYPKQIREC